MAETVLLSCPQQQTLIEAVQVHLSRIVALTQETSAAVANRDDKLTRDLDIRVEQEIGAKERALGALRQHRKEHGC